MEYSFELYGKQVTGFMDALNIQKDALLGQSMGGGISVYVAAHHPERINQLVLIDPAVIPYPMMAVFLECEFKSSSQHSCLMKDRGNCSKGYLG